jgi:arsenate reductase-like glutaredoxin family protein
MSVDEAECSSILAKNLAICQCKTSTQRMESMWEDDVETVMKKCEEFWKTLPDLQKIDLYEYGLRCRDPLTHRILERKRKLDECQSYWSDLSDSKKIVLFYASRQLMDIGVKEGKKRCREDLEELKKITKLSGDSVEEIFRDMDKIRVESQLGVIQAVDLMIKK